MKDKIFIVDIYPFSLRHNLDAMYYLPHPFVGELQFFNMTRVISNIATDIIPFTYPLHRFGFEPEYMKHAITPS